MVWAYSLGDLLNSWADMGVFAYALPFLMIFAMVYGILSKTRILGENKGVHATIALATGLLALQFDYVSGFYASIFPYAGMGIAVLLIALILMGLVTRQGDASNWIWFGIGLVIFLFVLGGAMSDTYWLGGFGFSESLPALVSILLIVGLLAFVIWGGKKAG